MQNVVSFKAPKFKPMPGELTPAVINGATLPVKIGIAQRAIAACCDLSELLTWKDKLAALAAAAKMARMPELSRDVNRVHKEAIFRMGEILLQYNGNFRPSSGVKDSLGRRTNIKSERREIAASAGISKDEISSSVRLAKASSIVRDRILIEDRIPASANRMALNKIIPVPREASSRRKGHSDAGFEVFGKPGDMRLTSATRHLKNVNLIAIRELTDSEKQRARKLVVEMQEILDEIDRRLGPA